MSDKMVHVSGLERYTQWLRQSFAIYRVIDRAMQNIALKNVCFLFLRHSDIAILSDL